MNESDSATAADGHDDLRCPFCPAQFTSVLDFVNHTMSWVHGDPWKGKR